MSNKESQWINIVRNIKLTLCERDSMRHTLIQFMEAHPVRDVENSRLYFKSLQHMMNVRGSNQHITKIKFLTYRSMIIGLIIALVMGGSVSFAAENTLPGDALYPVKVYVNENAREAVAFTDKSKAELAVELANRRLEEAGKLALRGTLDANTEANVAANVENHVKDAREKLAKLKSHDQESASEIGSDLSSVLSAHSVVLEKARREKEKEHNTDSVDSIDALNTVLAKIQSEDENGRDNEDFMAMAEGMGTTTIMMGTSSPSPMVREAAEGKKNAAQHKLEEVARKLGGMAAGIATTTAQVKFAEAQGAFAQGEILFNAGDYAGAFQAFRETIQLAQQAKHLADLEDEFTGEFKVDLHESDDEGINNEDNSTTTPEHKGDKKDNEHKGKENSPQRGTRIKDSENQGMENVRGGQQDTGMMVPSQDGSGHGGSMPDMEVNPEH